MPVVKSDRAERNIIPGRARSITLKFTHSPSIRLTTRGVTVFVGPNNSGKSLALREIGGWVGSENQKILADVEVDWPSPEGLEAYLVKRGWDGGSHQFDLRNPAGSGMSFSPRQLIDQVKKREHPVLFASLAFQFGTLRLGGRTRFDLVRTQPAGDWKAAASNLFQHFVKDSGDRGALQRRVLSATGFYVAFDATEANNIHIRLSKSPPTGLERSFDDDALAYFGAALPIQDASDGIQAYVGILLAMTADYLHTVLLDEPEAFLHPPMARKLGRQVSELARERDISLFAATHSSDFLMGCIQAEEQVQVVRLSYSNGQSQGHLIDQHKLRAAFLNPLMRSANALSSLFYDGVVVTESENDRAFYAEIYARIAAESESIPTILFVNAQNWQTCADIGGPLRRFGVPAALIMDVDVLSNGGSDWTSIYRAAGVPDASHLSLGQHRAEIARRLTEANTKFKVRGGINVLIGQDHEAAKDHLTSLAAYGIFVVPNGEMENWLADLEVPRKKTDWTIAMLRKLGDNPNEPSYIRPAVGDVWSFINAVIDWVSRADRRGMAA